MNENNLQGQKARVWVGVLYQENMRNDWKEEIGDIVQLPYTYCCHVEGKEDAKDHIHLVIVFSNTTTYKHAMSIFNRLSADGSQALNKIEVVANVRHMYDYLIHDTETCRKQKKKLYDKKERITGNNFDIGLYEQLGVTEKQIIRCELCDIVIANDFTNFRDLYVFVKNNYDQNYIDVMIGNSGVLERLTKANYQKWKMKRDSFGD